MIMSFRNLFRREDIQHIQIPKMQRDYAQGRQDGGVPRIRKAFLKVLHGALTGDEAVGLDFVYREVRNGRMIPLDGQQRLTTLFLLHWYLAARNGITGTDCDFLGRFTYETRYSARYFCENLVAQRPTFPLDMDLSEWLRDQHWYARSWKQDPTIQSMLVTLDDIHNLHFRDADNATCRHAWDRLVSENVPAISFESLSLEDMGLTDDLYIKMNSRGKPLTDFEHFKANFEQTLKEVSDEHHEEFAHKESPYKEFIRKVDQDWSDLLWPLRGDDIIDNEFLRLFRFLTDIVIYRCRLPIESDSFEKDIDGWAKAVYGKENSKDSLNAQRYLFDALDSLFAVLRGKDAKQITEWFSDIFTEKGYRPNAVAIFDRQVDLLSDCCRKYGNLEGKNRAFSLTRTLLLLAVLEYLMAKSKPEPEPEHFTQRLRIVRNLVFASNDQIRLNNFPALLDETAKLICNGDLTQVKTYNPQQIDEEERKAEFLARHPELRETLHRLEDHDLLRGCIAAFDLDATTFVKRAEAFHDLFPEDDKPLFMEIGGTLLACGDYSQKEREGRYTFGSPELPSIWRGLLTSRAPHGFSQTRQAFLRMLDSFAVTTSVDTIGSRLQAIAKAYQIQQENEKKYDWRYYLVKYNVMRSGYSGLYVSSSGTMGFDLCMMERWQLNSNYRDPYLLAVIEKAQIGPEVAELKHYGWNGYYPDERWIKLARTGENIMSCRKDGFQLQAPSDPAELAIFDAICNKHSVGLDHMLRVPQVLDGDITYDREDRILAGANLLKDLIAKLWESDLSCGKSASSSVFAKSTNK